MTSFLSSEKWNGNLLFEKNSEYRDEAYLSQLDITERIEYPLRSFWPQRGPQWDALGRSGRDSVLLVEAKANIPEMKSGGSGAKTESLTQIRIH